MLLFSRLEIKYEYAAAGCGLLVPSFSVQISIFQDKLEFENAYCSHSFCPFAQFCPVEDLSLSPLPVTMVSFYSFKLCHCFLVQARETLFSKNVMSLSSRLVIPTCPSRQVNFKWYLILLEHS